MHELITTALDLVGALLLVGAAAVAVGALWLPGGLAVAGLGLLGASWLADRTGRRRARRGRRSQP